MAVSAKVWGGLPTKSGSPAQADGTDFAPVRFVYTYLHDAMKQEVESLARSLEQLDDKQEDLARALGHLLERYRFLQKIYTYHSDVEDEVRSSGNAVCVGGPGFGGRAVECKPGAPASGSIWVCSHPLVTSWWRAGKWCTEMRWTCSLPPVQVVYPALELKVPNVTMAYSVEHEEEVCLGGGGVGGCVVELLLVLGLFSRWLPLPRLCRSGRVCGSGRDSLMHCVGGRFWTVARVAGGWWSS